ncbi:MAG: TIGR02996 domain-containing protein [Polyangiales bacterium]
MESDFLRAIVAAPDDDGPRLVYADWLMDRGDPRGELIQLQCKIARLASGDEDADDTSTRRLKLRVAKLLKTHGDAWKSPLAALVPMPTAITFRRGFVESLSTTARQLVEWGPALLEAAPVLRELHVTSSEDAPAFVGTPAIARLAILGATNVDEAVLEALAGSAAVEGVKELYLSGQAIGGDGLAPLISSVHLLRLRTLGVGCDRAPSALARASWSLEFLRIQNLPPDQGPLVAEAIASSPSLASVAKLDLHRIHLGAEGLAALAAEPRPRLEELDVGHSGIGPNELALLLDEARFPRLRILNVRGNRLGPEGAELVARSEGARRLRKLNIGGAGIGKKGALSLASSPHLAGLEWLVLSETKLDDATTSALLASPHLANTRLWLQGKVIAKRAGSFSR